MPQPSTITELDLIALFEFKDLGFSDTSCFWEGGPKDRHLLNDPVQRISSHFATRGAAFDIQEAKRALGAQDMYFREFQVLGVTGVIPYLVPAFQNPLHQKYALALEEGLLTGVQRGPWKFSSSSISPYLGISVRVSLERIIEEKISDCGIRKLTVNLSPTIKIFDHPRCSETKEAAQGRTPELRELSFSYTLSERSTQYLLPSGFWDSRYITEYTQSASVDLELGEYPRAILLDHGGASFTKEHWSQYYSERQKISSQQVNFGYRDKLETGSFSLTKEPQGLAYHVPLHKLQGYADRQVDFNFLHAITLLPNMTLTEQMPDWYKTLQNIKPLLTKVDLKPSEFADFKLFAFKAGKK